VVRPEPNVPIVETLERLFEPAAAERGLELVAVELLGSGRNRILRVTVDRIGARPGRPGEDGGAGVTIAECAAVSREISTLLDVEDPIDGPFHLEVSSPGVERPLRKRGDFERFAGEEVAVRHRSAEGRRTVRGLLRGIDATDQILIEVAGVAGGIERVALDSVENAHIVFHFGKPAAR
jgi:ribosome maturation factor RimP